MEWESFLFAVRAAGTSEHAAGLDLFESSDRISACIVKEHREASKAIMKKVQRLPPSTRSHTRQDLVTMEICTILRAIGTIYVIRKGPISLHQAV